MAHPTKAEVERALTTEFGPVTAKEMAEMIRRHFEIVELCET